MTRRLTAAAPLAAVVATCAASLVLLRCELVQVPYLNDSSVHEQMVRVALGQIRSGHFPPGTWYPYLNLGSPQFLHYQSLGAMLTALLGWAIGVGRAFTLTTWLLVGCWPLCVYGAARVFRIRPGAAAAAAVLAPFVSSFTGVGYEQISYLWSGFGLWSQLWAMWTLPFAWALSWRAAEDRHFVAPAAVLVAATAAFHFETGYLAFAGVVLVALARPSELRRRARRALLVGIGAAAIDAWMIVPLVAEGKWAAINQFLQSGSSGADANSYGARRVLAALFEGNLLDWHHVPILTPLALVGLVACAVAWYCPDGTEADARGTGTAATGAEAVRAVRRDTGRALVLLFAGSLVLFFGRPTLGPLLDALPGAKDLFLRRFLVGVQLAALLLAGVGAAQLAQWVRVGASRLSGAPGGARERLGTVAGSAAVCCLTAAALAPAWSFANSQASLDSTFVARQSAAAPAAAQLDALIARITREGGGRTYAGEPSGWGARFTVGQVPVYEYLASKDVDEVGFTLRTASLMSDPEVELDQNNPADYAAFGIHWLILPAGMQPPLPARAVEHRGAYALWELPGVGYVQVVDSRGSVVSTTADLGSFATTFLAGLSAANPVYPTVAFGGAPAAPGTLPADAHPAEPPGEVLAERADLADGTVTARVRASRTAVVLLSASYDPGWQVTVDGRPASAEMVAPALVGVRVAAGVHTVRFVYRGFPDEPQLLLVGLAALIVLVAAGRAGHGRRPRSERLDANPRPSPWQSSENRPLRVVQPD